MWVKMIDIYGVHIVVVIINSDVTSGDKVVIRITPGFRITVQLTWVISPWSAIFFHGQAIALLTGRSRTLEMAWRARPLQLVLSGGPVTPTPIREYNGLRGENRGPFKGQQASASNSVISAGKSTKPGWSGWGKWHKTAITNIPPDTCRET